ncbi:MAG: hypothetical protein H3C36_15205 [Chitinophagaceae bacterium]|nr:hypothetical protein [Chitinophagaceae bacterium]MCZ2397763.1 hypothetical protein [Chitinophagales bacterium]
MLRKIWIIFRWISGIALMALTIGAVASGDTVPGVIIFIIGLLIIPPVTKFLVRLLKGELKRPSLEIKPPLSIRKFIKDLDLKNDDNLIQTIDNRLKQTKRSFSDKDKKKLGLSLYQNISMAGIHSLFQANEEQKLQELREYFHLSDNEISDVRKSIKPMALSEIATLFRNSFNDGYSKIHIESLINKLKNELGLIQPDVNAAKEKAAKEFLDVFLQKKLVKGRVSPADETDIFHVLAKLGYAPEKLSGLIPQATLQNLKTGKLLWQLENGILRQIQAPYLNLRQSENCYWSCNGTRIESETKITEYSLSGGGLSFPVTSTISVGGGTGTARPIENEVTHKYNGTLYLTSQRVIFISPDSSKSFQIGLDDLLSFTQYTDGLGFIIDQNNFIVQLSTKDLELFSIALSSAIRNHLEPDNETLRLARTEIEKGKEVI